MPSPHSAVDACALKMRSIPLWDLLRKSKSATGQLPGKRSGVVYCRDESRALEAVNRIQAAYQVGEEFTGVLPTLIKEVINE